MSCHRKAAAAVAALGMILAGLSVPGAHAERGDAPHQPHLAYQEPTAGPQLDPTAPGVNPRRIVAILKSGKASSAIVRSL
ncbi:MAG: hypothetical protein FWD59_10780, partial [Micrococcales bacterium]|nr:hypothetical protein [Micrococcales bacterium]